MKKVRVFDLSISGVVQRFYLMIAVVAGLSFLSQFILAAILGFAIAVSFILGVSYADTDRALATKSETKLYPGERTKDLPKAA